MVNKKTITFVVVILMVLIIALLLLFGRDVSAPSSDPAELEAIERDIKSESFDDIEVELQGIDQQLKAAGY